MEKSSEDKLYAFLKCVFTTWLDTRLEEFINKAKAFQDMSKIRIGIYDDIDIYLVNGDIVKIRAFPDFVEGGNDAVYGKDKGTVANFMPQNEIWIDANMDINSLPYILFHEMWERDQMITHNLDYEDAHEKSNNIEMKLRKINAFSDFPKSAPCVR